MAEAAAARGVRVFANTTGSDQWEPILSLARLGPVTPFLGIHPWRAAEAAPDWEERFEQKLSASGAGVGEIGLDRVRGGPLGLQRDVFERQLRIAARRGRPVVLHVVRAWGDAVAALRREKPRRFMIHAFGGSREVLEECLSLGGYVSFREKDLTRRPAAAATVMKLVPLERLLLETDFTDDGEDYFKTLDSVYTVAAGLLGIGRDAVIERVAENGSVFSDSASAGPGSV